MTMKICLTVLFFLSANLVLAAPPKEKIVPAAITAKLKPILAKLTSTPNEVEETKSGWVRHHELASVVKSKVEFSDRVAQPYFAKIWWTSTRQDSKIYPTQEAAEKSKEWLEPGAI